MAETFITYRKFNDPTLAGQLIDTLKQHDVDYVFEEDKAISSFISELS